VATVNLNNIKDRVMKAARLGLNKAALETERHLKDNVGLTDHSQKDLDRLGNPYGFSHPRQIHDPDELVHTVGHGTGKQDQTGQLRNSITTVRLSEDKYAIGADPGITDENGVMYLNDVIEGTSLMRARNFPAMTLNELEENNIIFSMIDAEIGKELQK
jgi:hypothetical protein